MTSPSKKEYLETIAERCHRLEEGRVTFSYLQLSNEALGNILSEAMGVRLREMTVFEEHVVEIIAPLVLELMWRRKKRRR